MAEHPLQVARPGTPYWLSPLLAALGTYAATAWTTRSWAACPLGNNVSNNIGLMLTATAVWLGTTVLLLTLQLALRGRTPRGTRWLAPLAAAIVLALLYRLGMGWPHHPPGGTCVDSYPLFPFVRGG